MHPEKMLLNCKSQLSREAEELQKEMSTLPPGRLACYRNGSSYKCFQITISNGGEKVRTYIPSGQKEFARRLARKAIIKRRLKDIKRELAAIEAYLKVLDGFAAAHS